MIETKLLLFIIALLGAVALVFFVFTGNIKRRLWYIGLVAALTFIVAKKVLFPIGERWEYSVLGDYHKHQTYKEQRYYVLKDESRIGASCEDGVLYPKVLKDAESGKILVGEDEEYLSIDMKVHDGIIIAECNPFDDSSKVDYVINGEIATKMNPKDANAIKRAWRGDIIKMEKEDTCDDDTAEYFRIDGKPLTTMQTVFLEHDILLWTCFTLAFALSILAVIIIARMANKGTPQE